MPVVSAWECPKTKKLFKSKASYRTHLKKLGKEKLLTVKFSLVSKKMRDIEEEFKKADSIQSIVDLMVIYEKDLYINSAYQCIRNGYTQQEVFKKLERMNLDKGIFKSIVLDTYFNPLISNTHNAPKGKRLNFNRDPKYPLYYAGFKGSLNFEFNENISSVSFSSNLFRPVNINLGTGGGGDKLFRYEVFLFLDDFFGLASKIAFERLKMNDMSEIECKERGIYERR